MAHFLRGKQVGIQNDLSAGLVSDLFILDDVARYGVNSRISTIAYDPVQSLLAVGTSETQYGTGQIYVFGQQRVCITFNIPRKASVNILQFRADKLVSVDSKNDICIFSLEAKTMVASYAPPGHVTTILTDPSLDYAFIGLQNGDIVTYDLDRQSMTPFRLPNLWKERNSRARTLPVVSLALHPRDVGTLLIGYLEGAVVFSFKQNKPVKYLHYELPRDAPGGDSDPSLSRDVRWPKLCKAIWHPAGTFVLTAHEDSSLVVWDPKDGRIVMARTLQDINVNRPGTGSQSLGTTPGTFSLKEPIFQIAWCCKENPDDTGILIAGGSPTTQTAKGLTFIDLGPTPNYQTSSWQVLSNHFASLKRQSRLPTPPNAEVVNFCLVPRSSPHYAGSHDPIAVLTLLSSGELATLSFPSGHSISPTNMLHLSLSFVHPFINKLALSSVDRTRWLGWKEKRSQGPKFLVGGAEARKHMKRFENRTIAQAAHADGIIRIWDTGHDDEIENSSVLQIDLARSVGRFENVAVSQMSMAGASGEFSVGLKSGELVIFRWDRNRNAGRDIDIPLGENVGQGVVSDITHRVDPGLKEGFIPLALLNQQQGPVTSLKHSDVGFICVGFETGSVTMLDLRGPAVIYNAHLSDLVKQHRRGSIRKTNNSPGTLSEWPTCVEFGVLTLEGDDYSSILCFVGTNRGNFATFKILPSTNGTYSVSFVGSCSLDDRILAIFPIDCETGNPAAASQSVVSDLRNGHKVNGVVVAVTPTCCRIFKPATAKGAHKNWDEFMCDSAAIVKTELSISLVGVFGDGKARAYSIPGLREIGSSQIGHILDMKRLGHAVISPSGNILGWVGPSEVAIVNVWGAGLTLHPSDDQLFNPQLSTPPRPTISNLQWLSGTQYVSPGDMDMLICGPDRPPSKRMLEQMRLEEQDRQATGHNMHSRVPQSSNQSSEEGYWAYMQRQVQERTERLGIMGDSMDKLEESSSSFADDVNKFVKNQKRKAVLGALGSKFGL